MCVIKHDFADKKNTIFKYSKQGILSDILANPVKIHLLVKGLPPKTPNMNNFKEIKEWIFVIWIILFFFQKLDLRK